MDRVCPVCPQPSRPHAIRNEHEGINTKRPGFTAVLTAASFCHHRRTRHGPTRRFTSITAACHTSAARRSVPVFSQVPAPPESPLNSNLVSREGVAASPSSRQIYGLRKSDPNDLPALAPRIRLSTLEQRGGDNLLVMPQSDAPALPPVTAVAPPIRRLQGHRERRCEDEPGETKAKLVAVGTRPG